MIIASFHLRAQNLGVKSRLLKEADFALDFPCFFFVVLFAIADKDKRMIPLSQYEHIWIS